MLRTAATALRVLSVASVCPTRMTPATTARPSASRPPIPKRNVRRPPGARGARRRGGPVSAGGAGLFCIRHKLRACVHPARLFGSLQNVNDEGGKATLPRQASQKRAGRSDSCARNLTEGPGTALLIYKGRGGKNAGGAPGGGKACAMAYTTGMTEIADTFDSAF